MGRSVIDPGDARARERTMADDEINLSRRKVLSGLGTIGVAGAAAGAGTMAYFSDTEESTGNTVSAGTLDLTADGGDGAVTTVDVSAVAPGESGGKSTTLKNSGSIDGSVDLIFGSASNSEGDNSEPEPSTSSDGDLGSVLQVTVSVGGTAIRSGTFNNVFDGTEENANVSLAAGNSKDLTIDWSVPSGAGNEIQGDEVTGDITIELNQTDGQ